MRDYCGYCVDIVNLYPTSFSEEKIYYSCEKCHRFVCAEKPGANINAGSFIRVQKRKQFEKKLSQKRGDNV